MGCDLSKDDNKDYSLEGFINNEEEEIKVFSLREKDYFYWAWTKENTNKNILESNKEIWKPFQIDISNLLETTFQNGDIEFSIRKEKRKMTVNLKKKVIFIYNKLNNDIIDTNNNNKKYEMEDNYDYLNNIVTLKITRVRVKQDIPKNNKKEEKKIEEKEKESSKENGMNSKEKNGGDNLEDLKEKEIDLNQSHYSIDSDKIKHLNISNSKLDISKKVENQSFLSNDEFDIESKHNERIYIKSGYVKPEKEILDDIFDSDNEEKEKPKIEKNEEMSDNKKIKNKELNNFFDEEELNLFVENSYEDGFSDFFLISKKINKSNGSLNNSIFSEGKLPERKTYKSLRFNNSLSRSNENFTPSVPNIIFISDFFPKFQLFGIMDVPLYLDIDVIRFLKLTVPKNIYTLNELKETIVNEISKEAKTLTEKFREKDNEEESKMDDESTFKNDLNLDLMSNFQNDEKSFEKFEEDDLVIYEKIIDEFISFKDQADIYNQMIRKIDRDNINPIICSIYSMNGFLKKGVNRIIKDSLFDFRSNLNSFTLILLGVIKFDGINNLIDFFYSKKLVYEDPISKKKFIRIYKEMKCSEKSLLYYKEKIKDEKDLNIENIKQKFAEIYSLQENDDEREALNILYNKVLNEKEFISNINIKIDEIINVSYNQAYIYNRIKNKNLLVLDFEIEMIKNNPSALCLINKHSYYQYLEDILISPGSVFGFKDINISKKNDLNIINMEFLGNYLNPYDHIKFSPMENLKFNELHVENQKNKFSIGQDKILEYFSEAIFYNKFLKNLDLSDNRLNEILFEKFYRCLRYNTNITKLNFSNNNFGENYKGLPSNSSFNYSLPIGIRESSFFNLSEIIMSNIFLEILILRNIYLRDGGLKILQEALCKNKTLKVFDISSNFLTFECGEYLENIINKNTGINELDISCNKIFNEKLTGNFFTSFKINNTITSINLSNCGIDINSIFKLLDSLKINMTLDSLNLSENKLDDYEMRLFWDDMNKNKYNFTKLYFNEMGTISLDVSKIISEYLKTNDNLLYLGLNGNYIVNEVMISIFDGLRENLILNEIDLKNNRAGQNIISLFSHYLLSQGNLKKISMRGNFNKADIGVDYSYISELLASKYIENDITDLIFK